jgi:hypothetical protein
MIVQLSGSHGGVTKMMTSRDRVLSALTCQTVDHIPLILRFWPMGTTDNIPFDWKDQVHRVESTLRIGLDDTLLLQPPLGYIEEYRPEGVVGVTSAVQALAPARGERSPLLRKQYQTSAGVLIHEARKTEDWIHGEDVPLFSDYNVSRAAKHAVQVDTDLKVLRHLLGVPAQDALRAFRRDAARLRGEARRLGVLLEGGWVALGDAAVMLCGMERILFAQIDEPAFLDELLDTLLRWELERVRFLLDEGVDTIVHMAWYEGTDFWTPASYRKFLVPRIGQLVEQTHLRGAKYRYIITKGLAPLVGDILELGVDCVTGLDPVQDRIDMTDVKRRVAGRLCLMGGINSAVMLSRWTDSEIGRAVERAVRTLSPGGGFILFPVDAVFSDVAWDKVETMIRAWKSCSTGVLA